MLSLRQMNFLQTKRYRVRRLNNTRMLYLAEH